MNRSGDRAPLSSCSRIHIQHAPVCHRWLSLKCRIDFNAPCAVPRTNARLPNAIHDDAAGDTQTHRNQTEPEHIDTYKSIEKRKTNKTESHAQFLVACPRRVNCACTFQFGLLYLIFISCGRWCPAVNRKAIMCAYSYQKGNWIDERMKRSTKDNGARHPAKAMGSLVPSTLQLEQLNPWHYAIFGNTLFHIQLQTEWI